MIYRNGHSPLSSGHPGSLTVDPIALHTVLASSLSVHPVNENHGYCVRDGKEWVEASSLHCNKQLCYQAGK